jgi:hypothetical protein
LPLPGVIVAATLRFTAAPKFHPSARPLSDTLNVEQPNGLAGG